MDDQPADPTTRTPSPGPTTSSWGGVPPPAAPGAPGAPIAPSWPPASRRRRDRDGRWGSVVLGLIVLGVGLWYFADRTLGLTMPRIDWARGWPVILILVGAAMLLGSIRRR